MSYCSPHYLSGTKHLIWTLHHGALQKYISILFVFLKTSRGHHTLITQILASAHHLSQNWFSYRVSLQNCTQIRNSIWCAVQYLAIINVLPVHFCVASWLPSINFIVIPRKTSRKICLQLELDWLLQIFPVQKMSSLPSVAELSDFYPKKFTFDFCCSRATGLVVSPA